MAEEKIRQVLDILSRIRSDTMAPRVVRTAVEQAISELSGQGDPRLKAASAVVYLDKAGNDPNIPPHIRTAIWNALSILETIS